MVQVFLSPIGDVCLLRCSTITNTLVLIEVPLLITYYEIAYGVLTVKWYEHWIGIWFDAVFSFVVLLRFLTVTTNANISSSVGVAMSLMSLQNSPIFGRPFVTVTWEKSKAVPTSEIMPCLFCPNSHSTVSFKSYLYPMATTAYNTSLSVMVHR